MRPSDEPDAANRSDVNPVVAFRDLPGRLIGWKGRENRKSNGFRRIIKTGQLRETQLAEEGDKPLRLMRLLERFSHVFTHLTLRCEELSREALRCAAWRGAVN